MNKIIYSGDQEELLKIAGSLISLVDGPYLTKAASSAAVSRDILEANRPDKDHFLMHVIAMGCGEKYGANKNGDHFPRAALKHEGGNYGHHTFVKFGHYFEEHNNRDPKKARGSIKASFYNDAMDRVELLVWGHKKKAEEDYEMAKAGKELSVSMSCRVPWDRCSCCNKKAASSKNYCDHAKYHMTQWIPEFRKYAYVINDEPCFFDISKVRNRADRIAAHLEYLFSPDELSKAASAGRFLFSDQQAERAGILLPETRTGCLGMSRQHWLSKLAAVEEYLGEVCYGGQVAQDDRYWFSKEAFQQSNGHDISEAQTARLREYDPDCLFRHLAKSAALLPFDLFFAYTNRQTLKEAREDEAFHYAREKLLPTIFRDIQSGPANSELETMFVPGSEFKSAYYAMSAEHQEALNTVSAQASLDRRRYIERALTKSASRRAVETPEVKSASAESAEIVDKAKRVATAYGFYKIAFTEAVAAFHDNIDDPELILITSQH